MRTVPIITNVMLLFSLFVSCKKNNPKGPTCKITHYKDSSAIGFPGKDDRLQYNDDKLVIYTEGREKHYIYHNTGNIVIKVADTAAGLVRTDSITLNSKQMVTGKYTYLNSNPSTVYATAFMYNASGQLIRIIENNIQIENDTTLLEWQNGDLVKELHNGYTILFTYDMTRKESDGDPLILNQRLVYGTPFYKSAHLRQSMELYSGGIAYRHRINYAYSDTNITSIRIMDEETSGGERLNSVITYEYTCR